MRPGGTGGTGGRRGVGSERGGGSDSDETRRGLPGLKADGSRIEEMNLGRGVQCAVYGAGNTAMKWIEISTACRPMGAACGAICSHGVRRSVSGRRRNGFGQQVAPAAWVRPFTAPVSLLLLLLRILILLLVYASWCRGQRGPYRSEKNCQLSVQYTAASCTLNHFAGQCSNLLSGEQSESSRPQSPAVAPKVPFEG